MKTREILHGKHLLGGELVIKQVFGRQERLDAEKEQKEAMLRERRQLWAQKSMERDLFERAAVAFQKTGVLKKPPGSCPPCLLSLHSSFL